MANVAANAPVHITRQIFTHCYPEIREWLDIPAMQGHLMKYGLLENIDDMHRVGKTCSPWDKLDHVCKKARKMRDGYHKLYLCIRESQDLHSGHKDAADVLEEYAREQPERSSSFSSASSTTSYAPSTSSSSSSSSSTTPSSHFPPPHPQENPPSFYRPLNLAPVHQRPTLGNRSHSSPEPMATGPGGAGRLSPGRGGVDGRGPSPTSSIVRSWSNQERTEILPNYSLRFLNTRGPIRQESAVAGLDPEVELDQGSAEQGSQPPSSLSSLRRDSDSTVQETNGREYEGGSSLPPIHDLLTRGAIETLYECYHSDGYDIEFADSESGAELLQSIACFMVAIFNGRDRDENRKGILIGGVNITMDTADITGVTTDQDTFPQSLREELKESVGIHGSERELSEAELGCVEHEFTVTQSEATLLCVSVSPSWEALEGSLYYCREGGGRYWRQVEGGRGQLVFCRIEEHATTLQSLWQRHNN